MSTEIIIVIAVAAAVVIAALALFFGLFPVKYYLKAKFAGAKVSLKMLMQIKHSQEKLGQIIDLYIMAKRAKINFPIGEIVNHKQAGGSVEAVIRAVQIANETGLNVSLELAKALNLAGKNVIDMIQFALNPKVVSTSEITALAKNGTEVKMKIDITLKTNLKRVLCGASEETIISRVEEACISAIGSADNQNIVIENPDVITDSILRKDLDSGSMYEILSISCVSCTVGSNVSARLSAEKAEFDKRIAVASAETDNIKLAARETESKIRLNEMKAEVARQEAEVPKALVAALHEGKLSTMDYLTIENLKSDTKMRNAISQSSANNSNLPNFDDDDFDF